VSPDAFKSDGPAAFQRAVASHRAGNVADAERLCEALVAARPDHFDALHLLGVIATQRRRYDHAHRLFDRALAIDPRSAEANANHASVLNALRRFDEALACADRALAGAPHHPEAHYNRGLALQCLQRLDDALASYDKALAIRPDFVAALTNRGAALQDLGRYDEAIASFDRALTLRPDNAEAHYNRGLSLQRLQRHEDALASYARALAIRPAFVEAWNNRGLNLQCLHRAEEALRSYDAALATRPDFAEALYNRGVALSSMRRHAEAGRDVRRALELDADLPYARGTLLHSRMYCCDWRSIDEDSRRLISDVRAGKRSADPATILNLSDSAADQLRCSQTWIRDKFPPSPPPRWDGRRYRHDRIRLAYLSADFHAHATAHLMAGLFERHDRERADLFLDTLPCNAHTTASDALWAGLPVLTCLGTTFAGRVAASLLHAVGLPELVTHSLAEYETLALRLAADPNLLARIRRKLELQRDTFPLFDTDRVRRHVEAAYIAMWERRQRDGPPESFAIAPIDG
jgi:protein O-GlcNAc transferase